MTGKLSCIVYFTNMTSKNYKDSIPVIWMKIENSFEFKIANLSVKLSNLFANCIFKICTLQDNGIPMQINATC